MRLLEDQLNIINCSRQVICGGYHSCHVHDIDSTQLQWESVWAYLNCLNGEPEVCLTALTYLCNKGCGAVITTLSGKALYVFLMEEDSFFDV